MGNVVTDDVTELKYGSVVVSSAQYMTFESAPGTDYQVTAGKTLVITKLTVTSRGANAENTIGSSTAGCPDQAAAPAGWAADTNHLFAMPTAYQTFDIPCHIEIASARFPGVKNVSGGAQVCISFEGYEK
jgi:hypothetical protein